MTMDGMEDDSMGGMTMQMYFYASAKATILFKEWMTMTWPAVPGLHCSPSVYVSSPYGQWKIDPGLVDQLGPGELLGSCLFFVILGFLHEGIRALRYWLSAKFDRERRSIRSRETNTEGSMTLDETKESTSYGTATRLVETSEPKSYKSKDHILQTLLHFLQIFNSYCLMLVVMTYNIWLILSICLGASLGYYAFAWREPEKINDNRISQVTVRFTRRVTEYCHQWLSIPGLIIYNIIHMYLAGGLST
ncbi:hypothetical protein CAPTEDRAFT_187636 [Capitella teleta]|uniref:Copper transport protein n=1 Tax=Capitella teleta TaxID=283909 RepID=R7V1V0_CAPTE|nr:hypothetical protein CAPTEDRAFT_187636 [Capitella teleta]|eukprot:ELU10301.1 hypothetical protein CAPTEDRAFT_187636 [Capitella teleta]